MRIVSGDAPLQLDSQNGSWLEKQNNAPVYNKKDLEEFYTTMLSAG